MLAGLEVWSLDGLATPRSLPQQSELMRLCSSSLEEYRWWVHLWSDLDGFLTIEIPDDTSEYYDGIEDSGEILEIWKDSKRQGPFSKLSMRINLKTPTGYYSGTCTKVDRDLS